MSEAHPGIAVWRAQKNVSLTGHSRHPHNPSPVSLGFIAPAVSGNLTFGPIALAASIARTATLLAAPPEMLAHWKDMALMRLGWLVADGTVFALSPYIDGLADADRSNFAGSVGAGVTDLFMNALGYTWRDNAACLSASLDPHADFIYGGGNVSGHGVVLAEAYGSFAAGVNAGRISTRAKSKYKRQVKPYVANDFPCCGKVVHGYSIAFGSRPGTAGAFLEIAETRISKPRGRPASNGSKPALTPKGIATSLALAAHRSNFILMNALRVAAWIDWIRIGDEPPPDPSPVGFVQFPYAGRTFLAHADWNWPFGSPPELDSWRRWMHRRGGRYNFVEAFVMEQEAAERFLNSLSAMIGSGRASIPSELELPSIEPVGFKMGQEGSDVSMPESEYAYSLFRDGLALLERPIGRQVEYRSWSPKKGMDGN